MSEEVTDVLLAGIDAVDGYGIVALDTHGSVRTWNGGAARLIGIPAEEAIGRPVSDLVTGADGALTVETLARIAGNGGEEGMWVRQADGTSIWAMVSAVAVDGGFAVFMRDETRYKVASDELRRSKTMFEGILAIASDAVVCVDDSQRIVFFNEGAERMFLYQPTEVLGQPLDILLPERFRRMHNDRMDEFSRSRIASRQMGDRGEIAGRRKNGEVFPAEASISKLEVDQGRIYTAVLRDITERHAAQQALARQAEELARSNADLEQFAYVASHDLQEPLRMVASYTQLLARRYGGKLDPDADEFIGFAVDGVTRMQALINDLLAYSRVGTRGADFAAVPMEAVLDRVLTSLGPTIEETGARIEHDPLPTVRGDATQLSQLLQNLIQNGLKFQKPGAAPEVRIAVADAGEFWHFSVADNGIGIAREFQERIFVIFQRLHSRGQYPGTGIGLSICKKIVERHGGRIWVESDGTGSTFHFTLPKDGIGE